MSIERRKALLNNAETPLYDCVARLGGGGKLAWRKVSRGKCIGLVATPTSEKGRCKTC